MSHKLWSSEKVSNTSTNENRNNKRNCPKFMGAPSHESWRGAIYLCVPESEILWDEAAERRVAEHCPACACWTLWASGVAMLRSASNSG